MKLSVLPGDIARATQTVVRAVPSRSVTQLLTGILLTANSGELTLTATDLDFSVRCTIPAMVDEVGEALIPGRLFSDVIRAIPGSASAVFIETDAERNTAVLQGGNSHFEIRGFTPDEFPRIKVLQETPEPLAQIEAASLKEMIAQVKFAIASEQIRPTLTGAQWRLMSGSLVMGAIDGFRMAKSSRPCVGEDTNDLSGFVVPGRVLQEIERLFEDDGIVSFSVSQNHLLLKLGTTEVACRLIEGQFPVLDQYVPRQFDTEVTISKNVLNEAVARAGLIHRTQNQAEASIRLRVEPDEGQIYVLTQSPETGRYEDVLTAEITGKPLEIMFSIRPFEELLRAFPLDMVRVKFGSSLSPCICTPAEPQNGGDYLSLIMPLRITG